MSNLPYTPPGARYNGSSEIIKGSGMIASENDARRLWKKVKVGTEDECWPWIGLKDDCGYGYIYAARKVHKAHRLAFAICRESIPAGICVLHRCDNPPCCNPAHLFLGTQRDNVADMIAKGRANHPRGHKRPPHAIIRGDDHWTRKHPEKLARGDRSGYRQHPERFPRGDQHWLRIRPEEAPIGIKNPRAKLCDADIYEIRRVAAAREASNKQMAKRFGVTATMIGYIVNRKSWTHLK